MDSITIRYYQNSDREAVFAISDATAFFGDPVEAFLDDRRLYCDAFVRYYVDNKTSFIWVAEASREITGFLLGCADTTYFSTHWRRNIFTKVLLNALTGKYRLGKRTASFTLGMLTSKIRGDELVPDMTAYPTHLQIDVKHGYRGMGIGKGLIDAFLEQLRGLGINGVHLETTSYNMIACHLYEKMGFHLLDSHPNRFWTRVLGVQVDNRMYGLKLS